MTKQVWLDDRFLMESQEKAEALYSTNISGISLLNKIAKGIHPKQKDEESGCSTCKNEVGLIATKSKNHGVIQVIPHECEQCRLEAFKIHLEEEREQTFLSKRGKCGGLKNKLTMFRGRAVGWSDIQKSHSFQNQFIRMIELAIDSPDKLPSLFVYGPTGTGKTFLSKLLHNELLRGFNDSCFVKAVDLALILRKASISREGTGDIIQEFRCCDTLIIDDFGTQKNTEFIKEAIFSVLDARYDNKRRTIITTNMTMTDVIEVDPRLQSRLSDRSWMVPVEMMGLDIRKINFS